MRIPRRRLFRIEELRVERDLEDLMTGRATPLRLVVPLMQWEGDAIQKKTLGIAIQRAGTALLMTDPQPQVAGGNSRQPQAAIEIVVSEVLWQIDVPRPYLEDRGCVERTKNIVGREDGPPRSLLLQCFPHCVSQTVN